MEGGYRVLRFVLLRLMLPIFNTERYTIKLRSIAVLILCDEMFEVRTKSGTDVGTIDRQSYCLLRYGASPQSPLK